MVLAAEPPETSIAPRDPDVNGFGPLAVDQRHRALVQLHPGQVIRGRPNEHIHQRRADADDVNAAIGHVASRWIPSGL